MDGAIRNGIATFILVAGSRRSFAPGRLEGSGHLTRLATGRTQLQFEGKQQPIQNFGDHALYILLRG